MSNTFICTKNEKKTVTAGLDQSLASGMLRKQSVSDRQSLLGDLTPAEC